MRDRDKGSERRQPVLGLGGAWTGAASDFGNYAGERSAADDGEAFHSSCAWDHGQLSADVASKRRDA